MPDNNSPVSLYRSPLRESSTIAERAELLVIYSDKWVWGLVLQEPYSFKLLWHWCLVWCSPKSCEDRQNNLSPLLHAVRLSWNSNTIYSSFMSLFKPDRYYLLHTLSWTRYTQCRHSAKTRAQLCKILTLSPCCFWHPMFFSKCNSSCLFKWPLIALLDMLCHTTVIYPKISFSRMGCFFQISTIKTSKVHWICYDWYLSILIVDSTLSTPH